MGKVVLNTGPWTSKIVNNHPKLLSAVERIGTLAVLTISILGICGFVPPPYFALGALGGAAISFTVKAIKLHAHDLPANKELFNTLLLVLVIKNMLFPVLALSGQISVQTAGIFFLTEAGMALSYVLAKKGLKAAIKN